MSEPFVWPGRRSCWGWLLCLLSVFFVGCGQADSGSDSEAALASGSHDSVSPPIGGPTDTELAARVDEVLNFTARRRLNPDVNNAWHIIHGILAYGRDLQIEVGGQQVPCVEYVLAGGHVRGWNLVPAEKGLEALHEPGTKSGQGHEDQWLMILSQAGVQLDDEVVVNKQVFHVRDMVTQAQWDIRQGMEATWTLTALSTFLPLDAEWTAKGGSQWSIERIVAMEADQNINSSSCGGTHRLYGLTTALTRHRAEGGKLVGGWKEADKKIQWAIARAKEFQQPDGGFSTNFFRRAGNTPDIGDKINRTGHTLEFLALALSDKQLAEPWVTRAVLFLCDILEFTKGETLECAGLYHAAHGLQLYRQRRFGKSPPAELLTTQARNAQDDELGILNDR